MKGDVILRVPMYLTHLQDKRSAMMEIKFPSGSKYEGLTFFVLRHKTRNICEWKDDKLYCYVDIILNPEMQESLFDYRGLQPEYIKTISRAEVIEELSACPKIKRITEKL